MVIIWVVLGFALALVLFVALSLGRHSLPLEPALTPGEVTQARDPEFFALQEQSFREGGYSPVGDFVWHEGMSTVVMRIFLEDSRQAYGWAIEESLAGVEGASRSASVLTEFTDGSLLDTTSAGPTALARPPWFHREAVAPDTPILLRRHGERRAACVADGKEIAALCPESVLETIRRNERRLGEYQVETGRMRLVRGRLRFGPASVLCLLGRGFGRALLRPFRRTPS